MEMIFVMFFRLHDDETRRWEQTNPEITDFLEEDLVDQHPETKKTDEFPNGSS